MSTPNSFRPCALRYRMAPSAGIPKGLASMTLEQRRAAALKTALRRDSGRADAKLRKF